MNSKLLSLPLFFLLLVANILWGSVHIPLDAVWQILCGEDVLDHPSWRYIILENRLPQVLTATLCGASLGSCGLMLQTVFRNPLAGPSILGIDSGANLGVALVMLLLGGTVTLGGMSLTGYVLIILAAMAGAWVVIVLLLGFSHILQSAVMLLISGMMISYLSGSLISLLNFGATREGVHAYMVWGMGNFSGVANDRMPLFALLCLVGLTGALLHIKALNALLLGEGYATNLGFNIRRTRTRLLLVTGLLTAVTTAFCGPISFLGLAVPHMARMLTRTENHRLLMPTTMLMGATLALFCNLVSTLPASGSLIPINVITPCIGAPIVLYIMLKRR